MDLRIGLPAELAPYQERLLKSSRPFIKISPRAGEPEQAWGSKIGGLPYLPEGIDYPLAADGRPLVLLVQVNFAELPPFPSFPEAGLLQIYIHDDGFYGLNLEDPFDQSSFRVLYLPPPEQKESAMPLDLSSVLEDCHVSQLPFDPEQVFALEFELGWELPPPQDACFEQVMGPDFFSRFGERRWELSDAYSRAIPSSLHKMGGYARFAQEDPRSLGSPMELLLQLSSDSAIECLWGDMGIANFFICPHDLTQHDFSRVMYNWDSY